MSDEPEIRRAQYAEKKGEVVLREHEYDGIQEYDQKLPNWWLFIFIASFGFALVYWVAYYNFGLMEADAQVMEKSMSRIAEAKQKALDEMLAKLDNDMLVNTWATDPARVSSGKDVYQQYCIGCHGQDLKALIDTGDGKMAALPGLSLTDGEWKYGNTPMDIFKIINEGTPAEAPGHNGARMEAWGLKIPYERIAEVTAYVISKNIQEFSNP
jgi:cytochrome c oxidase cbb3-type subunit 3